LLVLTTPRRLALLALVFFLWVPAAYAWSRPVQGPVLHPFVYDEAHPYAAGQHRGIDLGADAAGQKVVAPAGGTVSFAGTVPTNGKSVTIETADGYSVTLTHLGSIGVVKGAAVAEQDAIGTVGPSGTPEVDGPYVHLGIRATADPNGYVDPLTLLPAPSPTDAAPSDATPSDAAPGDATPSAPPSSQPGSTTTTPAPPAETTPAHTVPASAPAAVGHAPAAGAQPEVSVDDHGRAQDSRGRESGADARPGRPSHLSGARETRAPLELATPRSRPSEPTISIRRMFVEQTGSRLETDAPSTRPRTAAAGSLLGLACNGAAALIALGAAFAASRTRRRGCVLPAAGAQVLHIAPAPAERRHVSRAA
jgi:hypothetical protein